MDYFIYDQRVPCRRTDAGFLEFYREGKWVTDDSMAAKWDTLADPATKKEVDAVMALGLS